MRPPVKALIDGDLVLYTACHAVQTRMYIGYNDEGEAYTCSPRKKDLIEGYASFTHNVMIDEYGYVDGCDIIQYKIKSIVDDVYADSYVVYLTGSGNFREEIYDEYKAGRPNKPLLYKALKKHMLYSEFTELVEGQEADDAMGIAQDKNSIICSYDKDMLMIPGRHYQFNKDRFITITEEEGMLNFYKQLLTGDKVDNIPGLKGVGPKTAAKILDGSNTEGEMYRAVLDAYKVKEILDTPHAIDMITRNARLLYIRQEEDELWSPPV